MPSTKNNALKKLAAISSISVSAFLCLIKVIAVMYTGSLAVLSSMIDSLADIFASLITFLAVKTSLKPASVSYRYGYGKAEALSALFQACFISVSGAYIFYDALLRLWKPQPLVKTDIGLLIMIASLIITLCLVSFQRYVSKKTSSLAIEADSAHYSIDILTNISIILSLFIVKIWNIYWLDSVIAAAISVYLLHSAYNLGKQAISLLLDKELNDNIRNHIFEIVKQHPLSLKIHDLRTRNLGAAYMFEFHLELDGNLNLYTAHKYTDEVERLIRKHYPDAQIIIHQDPSGIKEERLDNKLFS